MIRLFASLAILAIGLLPVVAQDAANAPGGAASPPPAASGPTPGSGGSADQPATTAPTIKDQTSNAPYKAGDQAISLSAGAMIPLGIYGGTTTATGSTQIGAGFGFSYRYFLDHQWAVGGAIAGAFNSTTAARSLFTAPLDAEISWWKAVVPFEFFVEGGLGAYLMRLDTSGIVDPFAKIGGGALWQTGTGWSVGIKIEGWVVPEIHYFEYSNLTRTGLSLDAGLIALYHI